jgi:hypothetical protein
MGLRVLLGVVVSGVVVVVEGVVLVAVGGSSVVAAGATASGGAAMAAECVTMSDWRLFVMKLRAETVYKELRDGSECLQEFGRRNLQYEVWKGV